MISCKLYLGSFNDARLLISKSFLFCPRIGDTISYFNQKYLVEEVIHSDSGIALVVSMSN